MWRDDVLLRTHSTLPPITAGLESDPDIGQPVIPPIKSTPPSSSSLYTPQTRAPKRHLSSTSLDVDYIRGRKLSRVIMPMFSFSRAKQLGDLDCERPPRSSSAPHFGNRL